MTDVTGRLRTSLADRYRIERNIGHGGMATVYLAHDIRHDRKVAVKVLRPELSAILGGERFLNEIRVTANLQHPHILGLYDSGEAEGLLFYVMPYVEGESLRQKLTREKQLSVEEAIDLTRAVASALDYAHRHGVVHRDIKPENILLADGQPLVADFGISLAVSNAAANRLTETGLSLGTPNYMSPEQATGDRAVDGRSDIYSLACVTYEMLTGDPPHTGSTAQAVIAKILTEQATPVTSGRPTTPPHVVAALHMALAKLPADRFHTAAEFGQALAQSGRGSTAAMPAIAAPSRTNWRTAAGIALVAALVGAAAMWLAAPRPAATGGLGRFGISVDPYPLLVTGFAQQIALSPDGQQLAYVGRGPRGSRSYIRAMSDSMPRPVQGTDGGYGPIFSPDGRRLAFWNPQRLMQVPVEGGSPVLLADSAGPFGAWLRDGRMVFADPAGRSLRVLELGGQVREVFRQDSGQLLAVSPLPDARRVLVSLLFAGRTRTRILGVDLASGESRDAGLPDVVMARYVPSGHVVYQRRSGGPLMAVPYNARRLRPTGEARPVAPEARITFRVVAQWDAAANTVAYVPPAPLLLVLADRNGRLANLSDQARQYHHPRFSPDGRRIALDITDPDARDVWVMDVRDRSLTRLTIGEVANDPFWSPDGRRLAYTSVRGAVRSIFLRNADGSGVPDSLYGDENDHSSGAFTPDGQALIASTSLTSGLWVIPLREPRRAAQIAGSRTAEAYPALSPDGRWLAYASGESGRQEVYVRPYPGPGGRVQVSITGGSEPVWSRDGRELIYREEGGEGSRFISAQTVLAPEFAIRSRTPLFDAGNFTTAEDHANFDISPDGRSFVMVKSSLASQIQLIQNWTAQFRP